MNDVIVFALEEWGEHVSSFQPRLLSTRLLSTRLRSISNSILVEQYEQGLRPPGTAGKIDFLQINIYENNLKK